MTTMYEVFDRKDNRCVRAFNTVEKAIRYRDMLWEQIEDTTHRFVINRYDRKVENGVYDWRVVTLG